MKLVRDVFWRCSRCGKTNRLRTALATFEPTAYACDHCGEESLVEAHDLAEEPNKVRIPKRHVSEGDEPS